MASAWDDFTRTADALLENHTPTGTNAGAGWALAIAGGSINVRASDDKILDNNSSNGNRYRMTTDLGSDQMDVSLDVTYTVIDGGVFFGPTARNPNSLATGIEFIYDTVAAQWHLSDGTTASALNEAWPGGTVTMKLQVRAGSMTGFVNGVQKVQLASNLLAGNNRAGLLLGNFGGTLGQVVADNFKADGVPAYVPAPSQRRVHRPAFIRKSRLRAAIPATAAVVVPPTIPTVTHSRAYRGTRRVRPVSTFVVPPQFNPPLVPPAYHQSRAQRGWRRVAGQYRTPVPAQLNPPLIPAEIKQSRALRGWLRRSGKAVFVVPTQTAAVQLAYPPSQSQRRVQRLQPTRRRSTFVIAEQAIAPSPAQRKTRLVGRFIGRRAETVPPQFNPPIVFAPSQRKPARGFLRKPRPVETVPRQFNPPFVFGPSLRRVQRAWLSRHRLGEPTIPTQVAPTQSSRKPSAGLVRRIGRAIFVVPPQQNPPLVPAEIHQTRTQRGWFQVRHRGAEVVPPQFNPPRTPDVIRPSRAFRGWRFARGQQRIVVPTQVNPPWLPELVNQSRALRGWLRRAGRSTFTVPTQTATPNPNYPSPASQRRSQRFWLVRRGTGADYIQTQTAVPPPTFVPRASQRRVQRSWLARRGARQDQTPSPVFVPSVPRRRVLAAMFRKSRPVEVVRGQASIVAQGFVPNPQRRLRGLIPFVRARRSESVPTQVKNPAVAPSRRARGLFIRRGQQRTPVPVQQNPIRTPTVVKQARAFRGWLLRRARHVIPWPITISPVVPPDVVFIERTYVLDNRGNYVLDNQRTYYELDNRRIYRSD